MVMQNQSSRRPDPDLLMLSMSLAGAPRPDPLTERGTRAEGGVRGHKAKLAFAIEAPQDPQAAIDAY